MVRIVVDSKCSGCETCVNLCPASVYDMKDGKSVPVRAQDCILCRTCESQCPEGAIQIFENEEPTKVEAKPEKTKKTKKTIKKKTKSKSAKTKKTASHKSMNKK